MRVRIDSSRVCGCGGLRHGLSVRQHHSQWSFPDHVDDMRPPLRELRKVLDRGERVDQVVDDPVVLGAGEALDARRYRVRQRAGDRAEGYPRQQRAPWSRGGALLGSVAGEDPRDELGHEAITDPVVQEVLFFV